MKKTIWILICLCSMLAAVNGYAGTGDWQKIENALYSIEVPAGWAPQDGSPKMEPGRREARGFELRYLSWRSPIHSAADLPDVVGMDIQSYRKLDGSPITISELEKLTVFNYVSREVLASSEGSLLLSVQRDSREMDGHIERYRHFYLMKQAGRQIHQVSVSLTEKKYQAEPEIRELIRRMLDSFVVK